MDYVTIVAPEVFSFIRNPEGVARFITRLKHNCARNRRVFVVLRNVDIIDYSAIVVMQSIMMIFRNKRLDFNGDLPTNEKAARIIRESGFFRNLAIGRDDRLTIPGNEGDGIFTHTKKRVDAVLGARLIEGASKTIWGSAIRRQGIQRSLLELMQNTHNHADKKLEAQTAWWVSVYHDKDVRRVTFSFVDYGIGVFRSLESKPEGSKFFGWRDKIRDVIRYGSNAELLRNILEGQLHRTVTGKAFRGKGLPGIKEVMDQNWISNLHVITNDVYANVADNKYLTLRNQFQGTFVYWEVDADNLEVKVGGGDE